MYDGHHPGQDNRRRTASPFWRPCQSRAVNGDSISWWPWWCLHSREWEENSLNFPFITSFCGYTCPYLTKWIMPLTSLDKANPSEQSSGKMIVAETEGFEPSVSFPTLVFKTSAFGRSATSPRHNCSRKRPQNVTALAY